MGRMPSNPIQKKHPSPDPFSRLLETTESLVYRNGIHATGIDAIVKAAGASRKTV